MAGSLLNKDRKIYASDIRAEYDAFRETFLNRSRDKNFLTIEQARKNKLQLDWENFTPVKPNVIGEQIIEVDLDVLVPYIDWTPFFRTWELFGKYPAILTDEVVGEQATSVFADAQEMLEVILKEKKLTAKGIYGIFPANQVNDDDIELTDENGKAIANILDFASAITKNKGAPNIALADFIAPKDSGKVDYMGAFCVTTGFGVDEWAAEFEKDLDDYNSIMVKALADRFAEAFAEYLHEKIRKEIWGYASDENLSTEAMIDEDV